MVEPGNDSVDILSAIDTSKLFPKIDVFPSRFWLRHVAFSASLAREAGYFILQSRLSDKIGPRISARDREIN